MARASGSGSLFRAFAKLVKSIIPALDDTIDLGSATKRFAAIFVVLALVTSITIGTFINVSEYNEWMLVNASMMVNASLNVTDTTTTGDLVSLDTFQMDSTFCDQNAQGEFECNNSIKINGSLLAENITVDNVTTINITVSRNSYLVNATADKIGINTSIQNDSLVLNGNNATIEFRNPTLRGWVDGDDLGGLDLYTLDNTGGTPGIMSMIRWIQVGSSAIISPALVFNTRKTLTAPMREPLRISPLGWVGINSTNPTYPLHVNGSAGASMISIYALYNISATEFIQRTSSFDKTRGEALDFIQDADYYLKDGKPNHKKYYGFTEWTTEKGQNGKKTYVTESGVGLGSEIAVLRQAVFDLKIELCRHDNSYDFCVA